MFDIGFWELATIAIIGIVVVGPDRLPEVVRTIAIYVRKLRRAFHNVKSDIERELDLDEIRRQMDGMDMKEHLRSLNQSVQDIDKDVRGSVADMDSELRHHLDINDPEVLAAQETEQDYTAAEDYADTGIEGEGSTSAPEAERYPSTADPEHKTKPHNDD